MTKSSIAVVKLAAREVTSENFKPYGQLITPSIDGKPYDCSDAQLNLSQGTPRFYIMRLTQKGLKFHQFARHQCCTQCLGSLAGKDWFLAVAPPGDREQPEVDKIAAFCIPGNCFIKLEMGTWHAGPYFEHDVVDFYNLELSNTNEVDRFTYNFRKNEGLEFEIYRRTKDE
ncbi:MAG: ureidoglycolate lyase [Cyanobacteriota bacterium]|nr:ureidoglycolate lyase [Cyanobacteriota bacterium]